MKEILEVMKVGNMYYEVIRLPDWEKKIRDPINLSFFNFILEQSHTKTKLKRNKNEKWKTAKPINLLCTCI